MKVTLGNFGMTLGPLRSHFLRMKAASCHLGPPLGLRWCHFWHMKVALGNFGATLRIKLTLGQSGVTLGLFGCYLLYIKIRGVTSGSLWDHLGTTFGI